MIAGSQCSRVLAALGDGRWHSVAAIHRQAGTMRLNSRVAELRKRGHVIEHRTVPGKRGACGHQYRLLNPPAQDTAPKFVAPKIPRTAATRYRIYTLGIGSPHCIAAAATPEDLGVALVTMGAEGQFDGVLVGVMDAPTEGEPGRWLVKPWREE